MQVSTEQSDIFTKVINPQVRLRLFKDLTNTRGEIFCKGSSDSIYHLLADRTTPKQELWCSTPFGIPLPTNEKELVCNFSLGSDRYFFRSPVLVQDHVVILKTEVDIFQLQRRQNYRIKIPESYSAVYHVTSINKVKADQTGQLYDLSGGGCRLIIPGTTPAFQVDDHIAGVLTLAKRESMMLEGIVRHHKTEKTALTTKQIFGIEFKNMTPMMEGKLFATTMDLHREFFARFGGSKT